MHEIATNGSYLTSLESGYWATARRARIACVIIAQAEVPNRREPLASTMLLWVAIDDALSATPSCAREERWYPLLGMPRGVALGEEKRFLPAVIRGGGYAQTVDAHGFSLAGYSCSVVGFAMRP